MARKRLAMELISNKKARLVSFDKRKKGLKKAASELSILCGVDIGMIIVCNGDSDVWPPNWDTVARMRKLHGLGYSCQDAKCRTYGVHDYLKEKREKAEEEIKKMRENAVESKYGKGGDDVLQSFSHDQLRELSCFLRAKIGAVRETIKSRGFAPEIEQQQILAYDHYNLVESKDPYLDTKLIRNPYMPEIIQRDDQNLAYYEEQNNIGGNQNEMGMMMMMESDGASCSDQGIFYNIDGDQVQDHYAYFSYENCFQNCGAQTEMMGMNKVEALMSYDMPNEEEKMMLQNWQCLMPMADFPADHQGCYV